MKIQKLSFKEGGLLRTNIKYGVMGIIVGVVLSLFFSLINPSGFQLKNALLNILFSFFITISIANIVALTQKYFNTSKISFWKFILLYYLCNLIGLFIGIELSYLIVSFLFDFKYSLANHINDYKFSTFISLVIGTLILLYNFQRVNAETILKAKEMDLVKLNQLKTEAELQALQAKINPHFLYNALNSIISLIHEDANKAEDMTLKLSKLFRYSINTLEENFSSIKDELEILNAYLDIEKVRFGNRIEFKIEVDDHLLNHQIPRFLLQPLVENALKHGLKDSVQNGILKLTISQQNDQLEIYIHDNGHPFPDEITAGYGLKSTYDKLELLYKENHDLKISNTPEKHLKISIQKT
jgi:two-component system, LytTR family, sensor kinase